MSVELGDRSSGCALFWSLTSVTTTGAPTSIIGSPAPFLWVLKDQQACSTAGLTFARDCAGATGLNTMRIETNADPAFYACGHDFVVILNGGTVGGTCVSGYTMGTFSLKNRAGLTPTIHGRTLDVTVTGGAGVDWANVENQATAVNLSATNIDTDQVVASVTGAVGSVTTVSDKTGYRLSATGVDDILDDAITEPSGVFAWGSATLRNIIGWLGAMSTNSIVQEAGQQGLCDRAVSTTIARATTSDNSSQATRGSFV